MQYGTVDKIIGLLDLTDPRNEGCDPENGTKIRVEVNDDDVKLFIGPRDWQWDKTTGALIGAGTCCASLRS